MKSKGYFHLKDLPETKEEALLLKKEKPKKSCAKAVLIVLFALILLTACLTVGEIFLFRTQEVSSTISVVTMPAITTSTTKVTSTIAERTTPLRTRRPIPIRRVVNLFPNLPNGTMPDMAEILRVLANHTRESKRYIYY